MAIGRPPLEQVVVLGGGQVALMAAIAVKRAAPHTVIGIVPAPILPQALADRAHTTLPSLARFHELIGMDEGGLMTRAAATHRLATSYRSWRSSGADWLLAYGAATEGNFNGNGAGPDNDPDRTAAGVTAVLARSGYFVRPSNMAGEALSDLDYALRFDPIRHATRLRSLADHLGIVQAPPTDAGRADLVIDTRAADVRSGAWIDWSHLLPGRSISGSLHPPALGIVDEVYGEAGGYRMISPGRDATRQVRVGFAERPDAAPLRAGRLESGWAGLTVAVGDAASAFEPLGWCNLHLALCQIELLVELLPGRIIDPLERAEYNRRAALLADHVSDFVAAHHIGHPDVIRSPALAHRLGEFMRRGRLPQLEEDSVPRDLWLQLLRAMCPGHALPPQQLALPEAERDLRQAAAARRAEAALAAAEPYPQWLARTVEAPR